jgi:hypothetical protein
MGIYYEVNLDFLSKRTYEYNIELYAETIIVNYRILKALLLALVQ